MDFKDRLKQLRISHGISQQALALELHVSDTALQNYEYGRRKPPYDTLIALADYFDVSLDYLVGRSDNPNLLE